MKFKLSCFHPQGGGVILRNKHIPLIWWSFLCFCSVWFVSFILKGKYLFFCYLFICWFCYIYHILLFWRIHRFHKEMSNGIIFLHILLFFKQVIMFYSSKNVYQNVCIVQYKNSPHPFYLRKKIVYYFSECLKQMIQTGSGFLDLRPFVLLPIRPTSTCFYSCQMDFWLQRPSP